MIVYLIRHGESTYNADGRIQGQSDPPLSELGLQQARAVAAAMTRMPIELVVASPLRRAMQTAELVAEPLGLPIRVDDRLMEVHVGVFQDKLRADLETLFPEELRRWLSGDPDFIIPGGESRRQLARRGRAAIDDLAGLDHRQVAVVAHGGLLTAALKHLLEVPAARHPFVLGNGSISQLALTGSFKDDGKVKLVTLNQTDHLDGIGLGGVGDL
ncbi:MAG: histidine phosphatase family protein [Planctomycetes bacterium]|nr:histidine phosphatase family protein [Planctomycetota bacterium]